MAALEWMYCSKCGAMISNDYSFCPQCGALKNKIDKSVLQSEQLNVNQTFPEFEYSVDIQQAMQQLMNQQAWNQQSINQQPISQQPMNQQAWGQQAMNQQAMNQQAWNQQPINQQPMNQQAWNQQPINQQTYYNGVPQQSSMPWQAPQNGFSNPNVSNEIMIQQKKKSWKPKVIVIGTACAFIGLIVILLITSLPKNNKDFYSGTIKALGKNLNSGGFEVNITVDGETVKALTYIDTKESEMALLATSPDLTEQLGIYKGSVFEIYDNESTKVEDISEQQDLFFKYYNKYLKDISGLSDIDLEAFFNDILSESGEYYATSYLTFFDFSELQKEIKELESKLDDVEFLKKNFDYSIEESKDEITHSLTINMYDFIRLIMQEFESESALFSLADLGGVASDYSDIDVLIDTTIEDGYLTELRVTVRDTRYNDWETVKITFSNFGSEEIDDMMDTVQRYYENMDEEDYNFYYND